MYLAQPIAHLFPEDRDSRSREGSRWPTNATWSTRERRTLPASQSARMRKGAVLGTDREEMEGRQKTGTSAPARSLPAGSPSSHSRYPLNSRRLTAGYLRRLAKALGLPTSGSPDQLRQCVEGIVQRDRDHYNVMVVLQESLKTEQIVTLEDSEGEFLRCDPAYWDTPPQRTRVAEDTELVEGLRQQLTEAGQIIASAEQPKIKKMYRRYGTSREEELTVAHQEEVAELKQQLQTEKERARKSWRTNCKHLAERDAIITAHDEELTALRKQIRSCKPGLPERGCLLLARTGPLDRQ